MANRLLISPTDQIKLSKPSINVLTAADVDLLMSPKYYSLRLHMAGQTTMPNPPGSGDYSLATTTINFGTTFANIPVVLIMAQIPDGWYLYNGCMTSVTSSSVAYWMFPVWAYVTKSALQLNTQPNLGNGVTWKVSLIKYLIFSGD